MGSVILAITSDLVSVKSSDDRHVVVSHHAFRRFCGIVTMCMASCTNFAGLMVTRFLLGAIQTGKSTTTTTT